MDKGTLGHLSFYITHVCNLNCENCFSFNNYALKGHSLWADNRYHCEQWAKIFDPARIFVLGGEPLLNPTFLEWMHGLAEIFPNSEIRINTNGTAFHLYPNLYEEILPYKGRVTFSISNHNENDKWKQIQWVESFLRGKITKIGKEKIFHTWIWNKTYNGIKDSTWPEVQSLEDYNVLPQWIKDEIENKHGVDINKYCDFDEPVSDSIVLIDENNIRVGWARWDEFTTMALKYDPESGKMNLHNSNPTEAVSVCHGGTCGPIIDGKFYKCAEVHNIPLLIDQGFPVEISEEDEILSRSYQPAEYTWDLDRIHKFVNSLNSESPIPQCKFCPVDSDKTTKKIYATNEKYKIIKKVS